jgi:hypothetical protein
MTRRPRFFRPFVFWVSSFAGAFAMIVACDSTTPAETCQSGQTFACSCATGQPGTMACGSADCVCAEDGGGVGVDAGIEDATAVATSGDASHLDEKPPPAQGYAACAVKGSFGWPCSLDASGPDPTECTDPTFPDCFAGGQSAWCTASCAQFGVCPAPDDYGGDAGCAPVACNARGYCK